VYELNGRKITLTEGQRRLLEDVEANDKAVPCSLADLSWSNPAELRFLWDEGLLIDRPFSVTDSGRAALANSLEQEDFLPEDL